MITNPVIPILIVLAASYMLVLYASRNSKNPTVEQYLYSGNKPVYALSSSAGSIFSISISCTALLSGGYVFGWQIVFPLTLGALTGLGVLIALFKQKHVLVFKTKSHLDDYAEGASFVAMMYRNGRPFQFIMFTYLIIFYVLLMTMEFSVARVTLKSLTGLQSTELYVLLGLTALVCYSYVFIGGYRGVLLTDHMQIVIILAFLGLLAERMDLIGIVSEIPSPTRSVIAWNTWQQLTLLHFAVFIGGFSIILASPDQWYRTIGTLPADEVKPVLGWSALIVCAGASLPILAGSYAHQLTGIPSNAANNVSLFLLAQISDSDDGTLTFFFVMAIASVILTTLDTYIMTIEQIYYEFSIRIDAQKHTHYLLEYLLKWKQIRFVGFLMALLAFFLSFTVADASIYSFGVGAISGVVFPAPLLCLERLRGNSTAIGSLANRINVTCALVVSLSSFPVVIHWLAKVIGPINLHLYVITASAGIASLFGILIALLLVPFLESKEKE